MGSNFCGSVEEYSWCRGSYAPTEHILGWFCLGRVPVSSWKHWWTPEVPLHGWLHLKGIQFVRSKTAPLCELSQVGDFEQGVHSESTLLMWTSRLMSAIRLHFFRRKGIPFDGVADALWGIDSQSACCLSPVLKTEWYNLMPVSVEKVMTQKVSVFR